MTPLNHIHFFRKMNIFKTVDRVGSNLIIKFHFEYKQWQKSIKLSKNDEVVQIKFEFNKKLKMHKKIRKKWVIDILLSFWSVIQCHGYVNGS